jgi:hypothetical protein
MKRIVVYIFLGVLAFSCRKSDNPKIPELMRVPIPYITKDAGSDAFINPGNPLQFNGKFTVDLFYKEDEKPQKFDVVIVKNGNASSVKTLKAGVTSFPTKVTITGQQLVDLYGPIQDGDNFTIGVDITTQNGLKLLAFPVTGVQFAGGTANLFNEQGNPASTSINYAKPCSFNADSFVGSYVVVQDDWQDYNPGTVIPVAKESATSLSFKYNQAFMQAGTAQPIILQVDPSDNSVSVVKQQYGVYLPADIFFAESTGGKTANFVNPCNKTITVKLKHTSPSAGTFDNKVIILRKQ